jgi:para-nitrobenzyl esterase
MRKLVLLLLFPVIFAAIPEKAKQKLVTQLSFGWMNYHWAGIQSETGNNKAYLYHFTRVPPGEPNYGAFHSAEFGYALKTLKLWNRPFSQTDYDLSEKMTSYWVNFAKKGDPNGKGLPYWTTFDKTSPKVILLGDEVKQADLPCRKQLEFFDKINK